MEIILIKNQNKKDVKGDRAAQDVVPGSTRRKVSTTALHSQVQLRRVHSRILGQVRRDTRGDIGVISDLSVTHYRVWISLCVHLNHLWHHLNPSSDRLFLFVMPKRKGASVEISYEYYDLKAMNLRAQFYRR